jgi:hypothetical protein
VKESSKRWLDAGKRVLAGEREGLRCPEGDDGDLIVEWLPDRVSGGEFRLRCEACGATNYVLVRHRPDD